MRDGSDAENTDGVVPRKDFMSWDQGALDVIKSLRGTTGANTESDASVAA